MISYAPFWETAKEKGENWYTLNKNHGISFATLSRLKNDQPVSTQTLDDLCKILQCGLDKVAEFKNGD